MLENHGRKEHVTIENYSIEQHHAAEGENLSEEWQTALGPDWQDVQHRLLHFAYVMGLVRQASEHQMGGD